MRDHSSEKNFLAYAILFCFLRLRLTIHFSLLLMYYLRQESFIKVPNILWFHHIWFLLNKPEHPINWIFAGWKISFRRSTAPLIQIKLSKQGLNSYSVRGSLALSYKWLQPKANTDRCVYVQIWWIIYRPYFHPSSSMFLPDFVSMLTTIHRSRRSTSDKKIVIKFWPNKA